MPEARRLCRQCPNCMHQMLAFVLPFITDKVTYRQGHRQSSTSPAEEPRACATGEDRAVDPTRRQRESDNEWSNAISDDDDDLDYNAAG